MQALSPIQVNQDQIRAVFDSMDIRESTKRQYEYAIKPFISFVGQENFSIQTLPAYKRQLAELKGELSISTLNNYLSAAISFMQQLNKSGRLPDLASGVKLFKEVKGHKKNGPTSQEIRKLVVYMSKLEPSPETARFKAIFCLKYYQGLRDIEIHHLDVEDIDFKNSTALVLGKGEDEKEKVFMFPNTVRALKNYLAIAKIKTGALFISISTNQSTGERLSLRSIYEVMASALKETGIATKKLNGDRYDKSPHGFRHHYTTKLLDTFDGDARKVMKFTRHRDIRTVMIYDDSRLHKQDFETAIEAFNKI